jgi:hypothetical protein
MLRRPAAKAAYCLRQVAGDEQLAAYRTHNARTSAEAFTVVLETVGVILVATGCSNGINCCSFLADRTDLEVLFSPFLPVALLTGHFVGYRVIKR